MNFVYWAVAVIAVLGPIMAANRAYKKGLRDGQQGFVLRSIIIRRYGHRGSSEDSES
jgi:hypothetical protein